MISAISPHYLGALTLLPYPGSELHRGARQGTFGTLTTNEVLEEFRIMLENIGPLTRTCVFRANHASNYLSLAGDLPQPRLLLGLSLALVIAPLPEQPTSRPA